MDRLARIVVNRWLQAKVPSKSPRAPTKFQPRVKQEDWVDVTDPNGDGDFSDITEVTKEAGIESREAVIRKEKGEYCVRSPNNPNWNGGCYKSKSEAEARLKQVEFFKRQVG
jgi:hypothetical protein